MNPPTLLLLHGLGANAGVWADVLHLVADRRPVRVPDLPGHGSAPWTGAYDLGAMAQAIAASCDDGEPVVIVGHSLGGAVGIELASGRYRPSVTGVVGLGIKSTWTDDDVAGMARVAERGVRRFDSRAGAVERFLRQSGLTGLIDDGHPAVESGVVADDDGTWRAAQDPATFAQEALDLGQLVTAARPPVILGAGEHDQMATVEELTRYTDAVRIAAGCGHNVMVDDPGWVVTLIDEVAPS